MIYTVYRYTVVEVGGYLEWIVDGAKLDTVLDLARFLDLQPVFLVLLHASFFKAAESIIWYNNQSLNSMNDLRLPILHLATNTELPGETCARVMERVMVPVMLSLESVMPSEDTLATIPEMQHTEYCPRDLSLLHIYEHILI